METKFIGKAKITKQGQLTLPFEAREGLKIDAGCEVFWYQINGSLVVVKDLVNPKDLLDSINKKKKK